MTIHSFNFYILFFLFFLIYHLASPLDINRRWKFILAASVLWITVLEPSALIPILATSIAVWIIGGKITSSVKSKQTFWMLSGIAICLLNWIFCKGLNRVSKFGVSFYSLQLIGFIVDTYRQQLFTKIRFAQFFTSITAFYSLSSGPVLNTRAHIIEVLKPQYLTKKLVQLALFRILWGLTKKSIGDMLGDNIQTYFRSRGSHDWLSTWTVVLGITAQYYADFSGYSDIAIGLASLLGIRIPENFNLPFLATSMADHWRRWHMSLSAWFQDYVFYPLCLFRPFRFIKTKYRISIAVLLTTFLVGLWHNLNLNNLIWGLYNGLLIIFGVGIGKIFIRFNFRGKSFLAMLITFFLAMLGRVLNRTNEWNQAVQTWMDMFQRFNLNAISSYHIFLFVVTVLAVVVPHYLDWIYINKIKNDERSWPILAGMFFLLCFILIFGISGKPFLYEQF